MTMTDTDAQLALDHARRARRVLIVVRRAADASDVIDRVSEALTADDAGTVRRAAGLWNVTLPLGGRIDVRPYSSRYALRGLTADTVLCAADVPVETDAEFAADVWAITATSPDPVIMLQRDV
jgi:hypothetical protein